MARLDASAIGDGDQDVAELAGTLVHEVKNPLSTLSINVQLTLEEWPDPQAPREARLVKRLRVMKDEVDRIEAILSSFLQLVRQRVVATAPVDVNDLLSSLVSHNSEGFDRDGIRLRFQPEPGLPAIDGDATLLRQAFLNLMLNAEQAIDDGGDVIVRTHRTPAGIEIEFVDTGCGIAEEQLPRIFRPYFSTKETGTGLGLPATLRIVRQHGGSIVVESEPGKGSRFVLSFPEDRLAGGGSRDAR